MLRVRLLHPVYLLLCLVLILAASSVSAEPADTVPGPPPSPVRASSGSMVIRDGENVFTFSGPSSKPAADSSSSLRSEAENGKPLEAFKNDFAHGLPAPNGMSGTYSMSGRFGSGLSLTGQAQTSQSSGAQGSTLQNMHFKVERDEKDTGLSLGGEYVLNQKVFEMQAAWQKLFLENRLAGIIDGTYSSKLFQGVGSLGYTLQDDAGKGLGIVRMSYAYLDKEMTQSLLYSGTQTQRMPQHSLGLQYEAFSTFSVLDAEMMNELKFVYDYFRIDKKKEYVGAIVEQDTTALWTRSEALVGFGGGTRHDLKLLESWGNEQYKFTAGFGAEYSKFDALPLLGLGVKERLDPAGDFGAKFNFQPWLQLGGDLNYSPLQTIYRGSLAGDLGTGLVSMNAERVKSLYRDADSRYSLQLDLPVHDFGALIGGLITADGQMISEGLGAGKPGDNLKLFRYRENPATFTRARLDAVHAEGVADKTLKVARAEEKLKLLISIDKTGLPGGVTSSGSNITVTSTAVLTGISAVTPVAETAAFSVVGGKLVIDTSKLSQATQTIWVTVTEVGGASTLVQVKTVKGSVKVQSIDFAAGLTAGQVSDVIAGITTLAALRSSPDNPVSAPTMDAASDTGTSSTDAYTSNTSPSITVPALTNAAKYKIQIDGGAWSAAQASRTFNLGVLAEGVHTVKYRGVSTGLVETTDSPALSLTIDTTPLTYASKSTSHLVQNVLTRVTVNLAGGNVYNVTGISVTFGTGTVTLVAAPDGSSGTVQFDITRTNSDAFPTFWFSATFGDKAGNTNTESIRFDEPG